jgi:hypothetical protein
MRESARHRKRASDIVANLDAFEKWRDRYPDVSGICRDTLLAAMLHQALFSVPSTKSTCRNTTNDCSRTQHPFLQFIEPEQVCHDDLRRDFETVHSVFFCRASTPLSSRSQHDRFTEVSEDLARLSRSGRCCRTTSSTGTAARVFLDSDQYELNEWRLMGGGYPPLYTDGLIDHVRSGEAYFLTPGAESAEVNLNAAPSSKPSDALPGVCRPPTTRVLS